MENVHSVWQIGIIALIAGVMIGALAYRLLAPSVKEAGKIKTELDQARGELNGYKASVNQHFNKTSELVNDLTQNYVKVYQHLAEGAQNLGDSKTFTNLLEQHQGRVSIAVDDETTVPDKLAEDLLVDPTLTRATPATTADEHAELAVEVNDDAAESAAAEHGTASTEGSRSPGNIDDPADAGEPVAEVDAPAAVVENAVADAQADRAVPEEKEKTSRRAEA